MIAQTLTLPGFLAPAIDARPALTPFIKWPGGKSQELSAIAAAAPPLCGRLIDPFVGGGSVLLATPVEVPALANDACRDLIGLYVSAATGDRVFREAVNALATTWQGLASLDDLYTELARAHLARSLEQTAAAITRHSDALTAAVGPVGSRDLVTNFLSRVRTEVADKLDRMHRVERKAGHVLETEDLLANIEGAVRACLYGRVRARYNAARRADSWAPTRLADFLFLREFAYAAMFRFNAADEFNVPYGGITYNRKSLADKAGLLLGGPMLARIANTTFRCVDFEPFLEAAAPTAVDFLFVDPPYDSDFSAYDNRPFGNLDHRRLRDVLEQLPAGVMVVIGDSPATRALYRADRWHLTEAPKTYSWTIKSRNDRQATHLMITNYTRPTP